MRLNLFKRYEHAPTKYETNNLRGAVAQPIPSPHTSAVNQDSVSSQLPATVADHGVTLADIKVMVSAVRLDRGRSEKCSEDLWKS